MLRSVAVIQYQLRGRDRSSRGFRIPTRFEVVIKPWDSNKDGDDLETASPSMARERGS
jgi:hypothetical protein